MTGIPPISHCIGDYDVGDATCVGEAADELPCSWKERCEALQRHLKATGKDIEEYVAARAVPGDGEEVVVAEPVNGAKAFAKFCDRLIRIEEKRKAKATKKALKKRKKKGTKRDKLYDKRRDGPTTKAKAAAKRALRKRAHDRRQALMAMFDGFKSALAEQMPSLDFATAGQVVSPGQLFIVDRIETSGYMSVYCQSSQGWNAPLISLRFRTATLAFDAHLPVEVEILKERLSKATFRKLSPESVEKNGKFKSVMSKIGKMELALLAEAIVGLVDGGIIVLPEA